MQKVDGVQNARVSLKDGLTILDLKPGNTVTLAKLREVVKNNGFVSKEAQIVAIGTPATSNGRAAFDVSGTREQLPIASAAIPGANDEWRFTATAPQ